VKPIKVSSLSFSLEFLGLIRRELGLGVSAPSPLLCEFSSTEDWNNAENAHGFEYELLLVLWARDAGEVAAGGLGSE
jgi:hypothetical protein